MPLPRKKDDGSSGAPILDIMKAHVRLLDVEEYEEPFTVVKQSTGAEFTLDPQFKCSVEIVNDFDDGSDNGTKFFESFKYKKELKKVMVNGKATVEWTGGWNNNENSKLGMLTNVVKPGYFDDESIAPLSTDDLEGFELMCRVKPKKNPNTGQIVGSTIDWETMKPVPRKPVTTPPVDDENEFDESEFNDIPF